MYRKKLECHKKVYDIDVVIAHAENATSGAGLIREHAELLHSVGTDLVTLGNHVWDRHGFERDIEDLEYVCCLANLPKGCPGRHFITFVKNGRKIGICVVLGHQFMKIHASCSFEAMERTVQDNGSSVNILLAEIYAEATSEKTAFGWTFDGKVIGIVRTHTRSNIG
jgi:calcineurin-like phosphoesterase